MEIVSLCISIVAFAFSVATYIFNVIYQRKKDTLEAIHLLQNESFDDINELKAEEILEKYKSHSRETDLYLARIEHFAVGINAGIYDIKTAKRAAGRYFIATYYKFKSVIEEKRKHRPEHKHYDEFEKMVRRLENLYKQKEKRNRKK